MKPAAGRALAFCGVALALAAIWVDDDGSYWDDRTTGVTLLVLSLACGLLLVAGTVRPGAGLDAALLGVTLVLFGLYLFGPVGFAFDQLEEVGAGGWLGVAGGALLLAGSRAAARGRERVAHLAPLGRLAAVLGIGLVLPSIWLDLLSPASSDFELEASYWNFPFLGHAWGIFMLVLASVAGAMLVLGWAWQAPEADAVSAAFSLLLFGFVLFLPVAAAFDGLDDLGAGAWLPLAGGALAAAGTSIGLLARATLSE